MELLVTSEDRVKDNRNKLLSYEFKNLPLDPAIAGWALESHRG